MFGKILAYLLTLRCGERQETLKSVRLYDGRVCTLRQLTPLDAGIFYEHRLRVSRETSFNAFVYGESERDVGEEAIRLAQALVDPDSSIVGAFVKTVSDDKLVGVAEIDGIHNRTDLSDRDHCKLDGVLEDRIRPAMFGMSVLRDYWGLGIGSTLLELAIDLARTKNFDVLELEVLLENVRAITLYERFGFSLVSRGASALIMSLKL